MSLGHWMEYTVLLRSLELEACGGHMLHLPPRSRSTPRSFFQGLDKLGQEAKRGMARIVWCHAIALNLYM